MSRHIDVHELLKCASRDDDKLNSGKEVIFGLSDNYVIFDTFLKSPASDPTQGLFVWNMIVQGNTGKQVIGVNNVIEQTIEMQAGPFVFPQIQDVPYLVNADKTGAPIALNPGLPGQAFLRQNNTSANATMVSAIGGLIVPYTWPDPQNGSPMLQSDISPDSTSTSTSTGTSTNPTIPTAITTTSTSTSTTTNPIEYGQYPNSRLLDITYPSAGPTTLIQQSTLPWLNNPYTQLPNGRFTIQVREVGLQSISDVNGNRHNFEYDVEYRTDIGKSATTYQAKPLKDLNTYIFTQPITSLQGISLVFRNPDMPITFEPDVYRRVTFQFGGPNFFINFLLDYHNFRVGDRIYIQDFRGWAGSGNLASVLNRPEGFVVANYNDSAIGPHVNPAVDHPLGYGSLLQNPGKFTIDPAVSIQNINGGVVPAGTDMTVTIYVEKRRMRIPIRFRSVVPKITNRIVPV